LTLWTSAKAATITICPAGADLLEIGGEAVEDLVGGLGPGGGFGIVVPCGDPVADVLLQGLD